jgi:hypothetical protein
MLGKQRDLLGPFSTLGLLRQYRDYISTRSPLLNSLGLRIMNNESRRAHLLMNNSSWFTLHDLTHDDRRFTHNVLHSFIFTSS